jgi:RNA polymerase sigma factor (sigma-70 family)
MTLLSDSRVASARDGGAGAAAGLTDGELLAAVRAGDSTAYAVLYELHAGSVRRLARRLCRDSDEADDVVSEVFANTLRAIQRGGGPRDEFGLYALRSVRNTVTKLRTRTDTARAEPAELAELERAAPDEPYQLAGDVEQAFAELPPRFQRVLWTTAVEGHTPAELAEAGATPGLDPGAVASLSQRARKALGRSYLRVHTHRPARHPECNRVRGFLPGYIQHTAGLSTAQRIDAHLAHCIDCSQVSEEMRELNGKLRTTPWLALLAAAVRRVALSVVGSGLPVAAAAAGPIVAIAVAGTMVARNDAAERDSAVAAAAYADGELLPAARAGDAGFTGAGPAADDAVAPGPNPAGSPGPAVNTVVDPAGPPLGGPEGTPLGTGIPGVDLAGTPIAGPSGPGSDAGTGIGGIAGPVSPTTLVPGVAPAVDPLTEPVGGAVGGAVDGVTGSVVPAVGSGAGTLLDDVNGTVDDVGDVVAALPGGLSGVIDETGQLVTGVGDTIDNTVDTVDNVTGAVADTVDTTVTTVVATVEQVATDVGDVVEVDPNEPVTGVVDDLVGGDGAVPNLVDNLFGAPTTTTPPATCVVNLLGICV